MQEDRGKKIHVSAVINVKKLYNNYGENPHKQLITFESQRIVKLH